MEVFVSIVRVVSAQLDKVIAFVIQAAYNLFTTVADANIFGDEVITMFSQRIYALLAIFMLFKATFSLITYIINPDDFSDKSKGMGKLVTNVIIVLFLIVSMRPIFQIAYDLQGKLISNHVIERVILGVSDYSPETGEEEITAGQDMSYIVYSAFVTPNQQFPNQTCKESMYSQDELTSQCSALVQDVAGSDGLRNLENALKKHDGGELLTFDIITARDDGQFLFTYIPFISAICGGLVAWVILMFCIDIAIRVVKLGFLQLIAPIPIVSYIDPKSGKDGMFKKWMDTTLKTYMDLFVRLAAISFAIFMIKILGAGQITRISNPDEVITFSTDSHPFVKILILLGILMFAKQIPKLIEDLTGIKMSEGFTLNPMKKIGQSPYATAAVGGALGAGVSAISKFTANRALGNNIGKSLLSGAGGVFSGAGRGLYGGLTSGGKGSPYKVGMEAGTKGGANVLKNDGTSFTSRMQAQFASALGTRTQADIIEDQIKGYESFNKEADAVFKKANSEMIKNNYDNLSFKDSAGNNVTMKDFKVAKEYLSSLRNTDTSNMSSSQLQNHLNEINRLQGDVARTEKNAEQAFVDAVMSGTATDANGKVISNAEISARLDHMGEMIKGSNDAVMSSQSVANGKAIKKSKDDLSDQIASLEHSIKTQRARASRDAVKKKK